MIKRNIEKNLNYHLVLRNIKYKECNKKPGQVILIQVIKKEERGQKGAEALTAFISL